MFQVQDAPSALQANILLVINSNGHSRAVAMKSGSFRDGGERIGEGQFLFIYY